MTEANDCSKFRKSGAPMVHFSVDGRKIHWASPENCGLTDFDSDFDGKWVVVHHDENGEPYVQDVEPAE